MCAFSIEARGPQETVPQGQPPPFAFSGFIFVLRQSLPLAWTSTSRLGEVARETQGPGCHPKPQHWDYKHMTPCPALFTHVLKELHSASHACKKGTQPTKSLTQVPTKYLLFSTVTSLTWIKDVGKMPCRKQN